MTWNRLFVKLATQASLIGARPDAADDPRRIRWQPPGHTLEIHAIKPEEPAVLGRYTQRNVAITPPQKCA